jgi:hypothetical protein
MLDTNLNHAVLVGTSFQLANLRKLSVGFDAKQQVGTVGSISDALWLGSDVTK